MPFPLRASPALGVATTLRESTSTISQVTLTNGATVANVLYTLGKGVWDIYLSGDYEANYAALQLGGEVQLKNPANATMAILLSLFPFIGHLHFENVRRITLDDDTTNIQVVLGLNGAAQTHSIRLGVFLDKLL